MRNMKDFFAYFFGQGTEVEFVSFGFAHFAPILLMVALIVLIYLHRDRLRESKYDGAIRYTMAFVMIVAEMSYFWRLVGVPSLGGFAIFTVIMIRRTYGKQKIPSFI